MPEPIRIDVCAIFGVPGAEFASESWAGSVRLARNSYRPNDRLLVAVDELEQGPGNEGGGVSPPRGDVGRVRSGAAKAARRNGGGVCAPAAPAAFYLTD
jgi:hypothetical protein